ncbi:hypothetical protein GCM10023321_70140 [Pseudonocardia eucalypti]|uniref:Uncharacterized protein n=1 Tax=Pseudonocardia eucalypti TaxID=648755 RepID=A0ABP9R451_9PSEU
MVAHHLEAVHAGDQPAQRGQAHEHPVVDQPVTDLGEGQRAERIPVEHRADELLDAVPPHERLGEEPGHEWRTDHIGELAAVVQRLAVRDDPDGRAVFLQRPAGRPLPQVTVDSVVPERTPDDLPTGSPELAVGESDQGQLVGFARLLLGDRQWLDVRTERKQQDEVDDLQLCFGVDLVVRDDELRQPPVVG